MRSKKYRRTMGITSVLLGMFFQSDEMMLPAFAQERPDAAKSDKVPAQHDPIEIQDEPKSIDPGTLVSPRLAELVTVRFDGEPLKKVFQWIQQEHSINVLVDYKALGSVKLLDTEPVFEDLDRAPLYLLLNRLERLGLAWYEQDNSLLVTSREEFLKHDRTVPYNLGDLIDDGYLAKDLFNTIKRCSGGRWNTSDGGNGAAVLLGDVVFIRQTEDIHREIAGLLAALRKHARRTFTLDGPGHDVLRKALEQKIDIDFQETPLVVAAQELSRLSGISIRVARGHVRERMPVSLKLTEQKLGAVLRGLLSNLGLQWYLQDEVLWITTGEDAGAVHKTAVFDVRDLCADSAESMELKTAIVNQTRAKWRSGTGMGGILETPKPGVMVVRHSEPALDEVLSLLENYRTALKGSKLRLEPGLDPAEVMTGYYRLSTDMAFDLRDALPDLVEPETWRSPERPDAAGMIMTITADTVPDTKGNLNGLEILVIRQSRAVHQKIGKLIQTLINSQSVDVEAGRETKRVEKTPGGFGRNLISNPEKSTTKK